ncbi:hypothetical protein Peur_018495 [Populus x canadensis]
MLDKLMIGFHSFQVPKICHQGFKLMAFSTKKRLADKAVLPNKTACSLPVAGGET